MEKIMFSPDGEEAVEFYCLEQTVIGAKTYLLVTDEEDGDSEALILRDDSDMNDEEAVYVIVDDDQELEAVAGVFRKLLSEDGVDLDI
ncbi:MAG: DUF1292 domain-containing protein [Butyrivibrio sp.]|uniref:DUF1292 domain-containing protein n=1 Tax=Butyrivibrio sp. CB08 TaxID=2364879 RepID=UPI000EA8C29C|nr:MULTISPECIES: DUF1292 domain-containing protein [unclassified Butyrivibrio]MBE5823028.1 DUF1292 domain-containing protein [Butyrivibrio sp.]MBE5829374.1 DUF1292 domain-containing protein [Butyrivibrio sp.]MBP3274780.1 DUF1292 domain-containing protein [Butyrivibrio sp.]MBP3280586.1 DUF1292 domain-containing protein [Butyrivibrio sp.]MBP3782735.1 DUF1292 domain-containing protein [Butyrivibrio sp.]